MTVNSRSRDEELHDVSLGDESASCGSDRTKFCHGHTVSRDDETLACYDGVNHFGVVISKFALRDGLWHGASVADSATNGYVISLLIKRTASSIGE
jgi:hypothetical protein